MPLTSVGPGSRRRQIIQALCLSLLLLHAGSAKNIWKRALPARLAEKSRVSAHGAHSGSWAMAASCPPPPRPLPDRCPQAVRCQADSECPRHRRCCYNGCAYACLEAVPPPPGRLFLKISPATSWNVRCPWMRSTPACVPPTAEACSTTEDGAEPLLCPSGYECHILSPGDVAEGIPNRGQCVKQRRQADGRILRHKLYKEYPEGDSKNVAEPGRGQQRHFQ
ncbi:hypothetical protein EGK_13064 [Macaca mulatta]|uniref:WAP four-disulfide core domain protein 1 n=1 Tax=Macaca mulatta TaxID=9544 RepID=G7NPF0_MACMU|nr:hypothetical protein EGK_13064 [Macaca mulatta]